MTQKINIFLMKNDGDFKFTTIVPEYDNIIRMLGLPSNGYIAEEQILIKGLPYTIYSKDDNKTKGSNVTAQNTDESIYMLNTFILIRENKNRTFYNMSTSNMNDIKGSLIVTKGKIRILGEEYIKNKIILRFD